MAILAVLSDQISSIGGQRRPNVGFCPPKWVSPVSALWGVNPAVDPSYSDRQNR